MPTIVRVYTGDDGQSHLEEVALSLQPFVDTEVRMGKALPSNRRRGLPFASHLQGISFSGTAPPDGSIRLHSRGRLKSRSGMGRSSELVRGMCYSRKI